MPRQRTHHSRRTYVFPDDFPAGSGPAKRLLALCVMLVNVRKVGSRRFGGGVGCQDSQRHSSPSRSSPA